MSLKKVYPKSGTTCKVTFELAEDSFKSAKKIALVGDFNDWDENSTILKKNKEGVFSVTLTLKQHQEYSFRYLIDGERWENDWNADKYVPADGFCVENSVVIV